MILHHGSNVTIDEIDLTRCKKGKDFGQGFYLNADYGQAFAMAERTAKYEGAVYIFEYLQSEIEVGRIA